MTSKPHQLLYPVNFSYQLFSSLHLFLLCPVKSCSGLNIRQLRNLRCLFPWFVHAVGIVILQFTCSLTSYWCIPRLGYSRSAEHFLSKPECSCYMVVNRLIVYSSRLVEKLSMNITRFRGVHIRTNSGKGERQNS